jgi:hypothetical protein
MLNQLWTYTAQKTGGFATGHKLFRMRTRDKFVTPGASRPIIGMNKSLQQHEKKHFCCLKLRTSPMAWHYHLRRLDLEAN